MHVAFLTQPWARALPPSESVAIWAEAVATRLASRGHAVTIWSRDRDGDGEPLEHGGVVFRFVRARGDDRLELALRRLDRLRPPRRPLFATSSYHGVYHAELLRELRRDPPDVVHVPTFSQLVRPLRRVCPGAAVVLHVRDEMTARLAPSLLRRRLPRADAVVGCSEFVSRGLREACPNANVPRFRTASTPRCSRRRRERPAREPVRLLYVGRISPEKGTHCCSRRSLAWRRRYRPSSTSSARRRFRRATCSRCSAARRCASSRRGLPRRQPRRLPAEARARIRLHGKRPHAELPGFYREADVLVVPSLSEAFGKPAAEAMASGLPVVATRAGGIPEVVADGETGLLVAPNDPLAMAEAIARVARDPALRARLGAAGRRRAEERFSYDSIAREVEALDAELASSQ